ncbi:hypothetical protein PAHAL_2G293600 [Panicum hallii]|uniref:Uncharacterized protein n=1 Tax=Panicum hallii TaxID=206008 RepID=A0A2T8KQQ2_9POAL|nr:hypothetical protein PAHAL_2G293600 [Panicum hallii]
MRYSQILIFRHAMASPVPIHRTLRRRSGLYCERRCLTDRRQRREICRAACGSTQEV